MKEPTTSREAGRVVHAPAFRRGAPIPTGCHRDRRGKARAIHTACRRAARDGRQPWRPARRHEGVGIIDIEVEELATPWGCAPEKGQMQLDRAPAQNPIFRIRCAGRAIGAHLKAELAVMGECRRTGPGLLRGRLPRASSPLRCGRCLDRDRLAAEPELFRQRRAARRIGRRGYRVIGWQFPAAR